MPFTTNLTGTAQVDDSIILEFDKQFLLSYESMGIADQFVSYKKQIGAKSISIPRYDHLALATTPLTETDDVVSEALVDSEVTFTPVEYGNVVTTTKLASLQTGGSGSQGGTADMAAARVVGINMGRTSNKLALLAADASANVIYANDATSTVTLDAADIMSSTELDEVYNKLARASVPAIGSEYVALMHDDVIHDLRATSAAGTWVDVNKYARPDEVLKNEVGMYKGFRIIRDNLCLLQADGGSGTVDAYTSYFLGLDALGKAASQEPTMIATGPFDKLARFINIGWHGCFQYKILQQDALWTVESASSVGANA